MRIVSEEEVMAGLRALPREGQNPGCKYTVISKVDGTAKHCGVGQMLVNLGLPCPGEYSLVNGDAIDMGEMSHWLEDHDVAFDDEAMRMLGGFQGILDSQCADTWGEALDMLDLQRQREEANE